MSLLPPSPLLPETINPGDSGHIGHHEQIHHILNELPFTADGALAARPAAGNKGAFYIASWAGTTIVRLYIDTGTAWLAVNDQPGDFDPLDFGADPLGVADSQAAFSAARDAARLAGGRVMVTSGTYKALSSVSVTVANAGQRAAFVARATGSVTLTPPTDNTPFFDIQHLSGGATGGLRIEGFRFNGRRAAILRHSWNVSFFDCRVTSSSSFAPFQAFNCFWVTWDATPGSIFHTVPAEVPILEWIGDINLPRSADTSYLLKFSNQILGGGGIRLIQSGATGYEAPQFIFDYLGSESFNVDTAMVDAAVGVAFYDAVITAGSSNVSITDTTYEQFAPTDVGKYVSAPGFPPGTTIITYIDPTHVVLSASARNTHSPATLVVGRTILWGGFRQVSLRQLDHFDAIGAGPFPFFRCLDISTSGADVILDNCHTGPRPVEVVGSTPLSAVWIGRTPSVPIVQKIDGSDAANNAGVWSIMVAPSSVKVGRAPEMTDPIATDLALLSLRPSLWLSTDGPFYQDSARSIPATADGDPIGSWFDKSGNGRHAVQATAGARPLLKLSIINGQKVARFDAVDDNLVAPMDASCAQTIFVVAVKLSGTTGTDRALFGLGGGTRFLGVQNGGTAYVYAQNQAGGFVTVSGSPATTVAVISLSYNSLTSATARRNGGAGAAFDPLNGFEAATALTLAAEVAGGTRFGDYDIASVFRVPRELTLVEHNFVGKYLAAKFGITWTTAT